MICDSFGLRDCGAEKSAASQPETEEPSACTCCRLSRHCTSAEASEGYECAIESEFGITPLSPFSRQAIRGV
jgi:hypothetical protein